MPMFHWYQYRGTTPYTLATCVYNYVLLIFYHCLFHNLAFKLVNKEMAIKFEKLLYMY